jgi:hypothetical protein
VADWRQIRARIRRAKAGPDAATRLEQLFDKTRDGMVAFELAQLEENAGRIERATDWYKRAWQRFRRAEWKQKAEEALIRHGMPIPVEESPQLAPSPETASSTDEPSAETSEEVAFQEHEPHVAPEQAPVERPLQSAANEQIAEAAAQENAPLALGEPEIAASSETARQSRRRRHRGGRGRGRSKRAAESPVQAGPELQDRAPTPAPPRRTKESERHQDHRSAREHLPEVQIYRRGEPALVSEIKALEAKLRQLLASQPRALGDPGELPANPGVFLVSDLDLTTMYYLEACGNMRSAMDQLISGRRGRQGSIRSRLAKYLGISDSQASRYLKEHCAARWIDLEESDSNALGHFARAVLRPELMEESD